MLERERERERDSDSDSVLLFTVLTCDKDINGLNLSWHIPVTLLEKYDIFTFVLHIS